MTPNEVRILSAFLFRTYVELLSAGVDLFVFILVIKETDICLRVPLSTAAYLFSNTLKRHDQITQKNQKLTILTGLSECHVDLTIGQS